MFIDSAIYEQKSRGLESSITGVTNAFPFSLGNFISKPGNLV